MGSYVCGAAVTKLALLFLDMAKFHTDEALFSIKTWEPGTLGYEVGLLHGAFGKVLYEVAVSLGGGNE